MVITHGGNAFAVADRNGWDWRDIIDFSASINPLGPSPLVREAINNALEAIVHYPDPSATRLRRALSEAWNIDPDCILTGNGATELIHFLARTWHEPSVTLVVPTFSELHRAYPEARFVPQDDPSLWPDDGLLIVTNPNNPTGEPQTVVERRGSTIVDESFIEFTDLPSAIGSERIVIRSLTKFQAIPGLRVGALIAPAELIRGWRLRREPWQVNVLAEAAALAAIIDTEHARRTRAFVAQERQRLKHELAQMPGVEEIQGTANYVFVRLTYSASLLCDYMQNHKVLLRNCSGTPGISGEALRVAVRTSGQNDRLLDLWRTFCCD